jgi:hypothetical protein
VKRESVTAGGGSSRFEFAFNLQTSRSSEVPVTPNRTDRRGHRIAVAGMGAGRNCSPHKLTLETKIANLRTRSANGTRLPIESHGADRRCDLLYEHMRDTLRQIIPYERPKLAAIPPAGDQNNPMQVKPDLSKLSDVELDQLEGTSNNDDFFVGLIAGAARR